MSRVDAFEFLDLLRESGVTNMFGAAPYLADEFGIGVREARPIVNDWMESFSRDKTAEERAAQFDDAEVGS